MHEIWMVEWSGMYVEYNAAFSTRDKAIAYIEKCARDMFLYRNDFCIGDFYLVEEDQFGELDDPWWGVYQLDSCDEESPIQIRYQRYDVDLY